MDPKPPKTLQNPETNGFKCFEIATTYLQSSSERKGWASGSQLI